MCVKEHFLVLPTEKARNNGKPSSNEYPQYLDCGFQVPVLIKNKGHGYMVDSRSGKEMYNMILAELLL